MNDQSNAGIVTLRKPRANSWIAGMFGWVLKRGWIDVEAEVQDCTAVRSAPSTRVNDPRWGGYIVGFSYIVDGKTYDGVTNSLDELQPGDKFAIRCDPQRPGDNNTFESETKWVAALNWVLWCGVALVFVGYYLWERLGRK